MRQSGTGLARAASVRALAPPALDRLEVCRNLREIGQRLRLAGASPFRARAFERGAHALEGVGEDLGLLQARGALQDVKGIGPGLAGVIEELLSRGRSSLLDALRADMPPGALELSRLRSLPLPRIRALHEALRIETMDALEAACAQGRVREVKGFGPGTEARLLAEIRRWRENAGQLLLHQALELGEALVAHLRAAAGVTRADYAGALRRGHEHISELSLVATGRGPQAALSAFARFPRVEGVLERGASRVAVRLAGGLRASLEWVEPERYGSALVRLTGSESHWRALEQLAARSGGPDDLERVAASEESAFYAQVRLPLIAPELREGQGECEAALAGTLPDLLRPEEILGLVHCHTLHSDGRDTVLDMARGAEALGMRYLTVTDHSPAASYANGVSLERLERQWEEIAQAQEQTSVRILRGSECDILADGSLDYPDRVLERLDVIIASIHVRHSMDPEAMTRRLVRALQHPAFKIWGHARGRLIGRRPPFECHMPEVLEAAAASRAAIEVNGDPHRLDLDPAWIRRARELGLRFVVSVDAHSLLDLRNLRYGVTTARRGWLRKGDVLNTLPADEFAQAVRPL